MNADFEKSEDNVQAVTALDSTNSVMLALSTFKHSDKAIETAIEKASQCKKLVIAYGHEVNLWSYFIGTTNIGLFPDLKEQCEKEILMGIEQKWKKKIDAIAAEARAEDLQVVTYVKAKSFKKLCLEVIEKEKPFLVITTKTLKPAWFRNLYHFPAD